MCCARAVKRPVAALHCAAPSRSNRAVRLQRGACWPRRPLNSRARHHVARLPPANPPPSCTTHPAGALNPDDSCAGLCSAVPLPPNPVEHVSSLRHSRRGLRHAAAAGWLTPRQRTPATGATSRAATVSRSDHHGRAAVLCRRQPGSPPSPSRPCCGRRAGSRNRRRSANHGLVVLGVQEAVLRHLQVVGGGPLADAAADVVVAAVAGAEPAVVVASACGEGGGCSPSSAVLAAAPAARCIWPATQPRLPSANTTALRWAIRVQQRLGPPPPPHIHKQRWPCRPPAMGTQPR